MSRFGSGDRNDFPREAYKKATPVSLNKDKTGSNKKPVADSSRQRVRTPVNSQKAKFAEISGSSGETKGEQRTPINPVPANHVKVPRRNGGGGSPKKDKPKKKRLPFVVVLIIDILIAAMVLLLFYEIEVADPSGTADVGLTPQVSVSSFATLTPVETESPEPTATQTPDLMPTATIDPNDWRTKFADKFSADGTVHQQSTADNWTYQSANISVDVTKNTDNGVVYFVTDIYVADIKYFRTSFGGGPDAEGTRAFVVDALQNAGGIVAVNGDYYPRNGGLTIRNGQYINYAKTSADKLVMYTDGTMQAFSASDFNVEDIKAQAPDTVYQVWAFGPMLLDSSGQPLTSFNSRLTSANNPRTAIGYFEPGHYCFVTVDGRQKGYSYPGYSLTQLSQLMYDLGCKVAFNLDGGGSTQLAFMGDEINQPCGDRRKDYDIVYITDEG